METDLAERIVSQVSDAIKKAAVTESTYTFSPPSRSIFSPENLDPVIHVLVPVTAPVRRILPRKPGFGEAAGWKMLTSRLDNTVSGTNATISFADAGQPGQTSQTYTFKTAPYKNLGRDVEIGRQQIAANRGMKLEDIRAQQEQVKTVEVLLGEENMLLNGNSGTTATDFDGFSTVFVSNSATGVTYMTASGIGKIAKGLFDKGAENPTDWIANSRQNQALADDLQGGGSIQRIVMDQGQATGGAHVDKIVNPVSGSLINIVTSRYSGANGFLLTVKDVTGENWIEMEDLEPMSVYDVPTANHSLVSRVYETCVLKVKGEVYQAIQTGLSLS